MRRLAGHDLGDVQIVIAQRDVDFVQQHHADLGVADQFFGLVPAGTGGGDVARLVLGFPGKALAHGVKLAQPAEMRGQQAAFAGVPCALDELHHRAGHPMRDAAQDHPEPGRGLALALAGMNDHQPLFAGLSRHHAVAGGLDPCHLLGVAGVFIGIHRALLRLTSRGRARTALAALVPVL